MRFLHFFYKIDQYICYIWTKRRDLLRRMRGKLIIRAPEPRRSPGSASVPGVSVGAGRCQLSEVTSQRWRRAKRKAWRHPAATSSTREARFYNTRGEWWQGRVAFASAANGSWAREVRDKTHVCTQISCQQHSYSYQCPKTQCLPKTHPHKFVFSFSSTCKRTVLKCDVCACFEWTVSVVRSLLRHAFRWLTMHLHQSYE